MEEWLIKRMLEDLKTSGVKSITWTGGGEPTLHPLFDQATKWAIPLKQGLYTHGGHIDKARAASLKLRLTFAYVSLDALDAESYKAAKGVDRFDAACEGVRRLVTAKGKATVGVGFLLTEKNWHQAREMAALAAELGADYAQFRPTILYDMKDPAVPSEDTSWMDEPLREQLDGLASNTKVSIDVERFRQYRYWKGHGYDTCWWSMFQTCITPNGKVWTCVNKREHPGAEIGDLSIESFSEIWRRHTAAKVTGDCRVMCRGHLANQTLETLVNDPPHVEFV